MDNLQDLTVQEAVMERHEKVIEAVGQLDRDLCPSPGKDFKIKEVIANLQLVHKMTGEMQKILVAAAIGDGVDDEDDDGPA